MQWHIKALGPHNGPQNRDQTEFRLLSAPWSLCPCACRLVHLNLCNSYVINTPRPGKFPVYFGYVCWKNGDKFLPHPHSYAPTHSSIHAPSTHSSNPRPEIMFKNFLDKMSGKSKLICHFQIWYAIFFSISLPLSGSVHAVTRPCSQKWFITVFCLEFVNL